MQFKPNKSYLIPPEVIVATIDYDDLYSYLVDFQSLEEFNNEQCYFKDYQDMHNAYFGAVHVVVYRYLISREYIEKSNPLREPSFDNTMDDLYRAILDSLEATGVIVGTRDEEFPRIIRYNLIPG